MDEHNNQMVAATSQAALVSAEQQRAIAEVQAALIIARSNPRDTKRALDLIEMDCARPGLAEQATYNYARGGTAVTGPSIRLAECIAQRWGNMQFGIRELEQRDGESVVQAYAWDVETNTRREMTFTVPHVRDTKQGQKALRDARDIYEMVANQGARRLRACILGVIPGDIVERAVEQADETLRTKTPVTPERVGKLIEFFAGYGVAKEQIEKRIQRRLDALTPALMAQLGKIANSLRDGMSTPADWFDVATSDGATVIQMPQRRSETAKAADAAAQSSSPAVGTADNPATSDPAQTSGSPAPDQQQAPAGDDAKTAPAPATTTATTAAQEKLPKPLTYQGQTVRVLRVWQPDPAKSGRYVETSEGLAHANRPEAVKALEAAATSNAAVKLTGAQTAYAAAPFQIHAVTLDLPATAKAAAPPSMPAAGDLNFGSGRTRRDREPGEEG